MTEVNTPEANLRESESPQGEWSPDQLNRLWVWLLHEDVLFNGRTNFFVVAESMLVTAFTLNFVSTHRDSLVLQGIVVAGLGLAAIWSYLTCYQVHTTMKPLKRLLVEKLPEYGMVAKPRSTIPGPNFILSIVLPGLLAGLWVYLAARIP